MDDIKQNLIQAEKKAAELFEAIQERKLLIPGKSEKELNKEIHQLAKELFNVKKHWHKRIVRTGRNTLFPYRENPPTLILQEDDILFLDFGPIFEEWEADFGRTYVIGKNSRKLKLKADVELAWSNARDWFQRQPTVTGSMLFDYCKNRAISMGWKFGASMAGHIVGKFPHEKLKLWQKDNYIHPRNKIDMRTPDKNGNERYWILEIHLIDEENEIGAFYEQLLI